MTIPDESRVGLDSVALIYFLESNPRYRDAAEELLRRIEEGALEGVLATVALAEVLVGEYRRSADRGRALRRQITAQPNLEMVDLTPEIADRAARLRAEHGLHVADAVHAATALERDAGWLVTNDRRLRRLEREGIRVWLFDDHL